MSKLDEDYYLRKQFLGRNEVPTQTMMKQKMGEPLSKLYFKDMGYRSKVLAGLEPTLGEGCGDWYMPPTEVLKGRSVLKSVKKGCLPKLKYTGIVNLGEHLLKVQANENESEKKRAIATNDRKWRKIIKQIAQDHEKIVTLSEVKYNTRKVNQTLKVFDEIYVNSLKKIDDILIGAASGAIERIREEAFDLMERYYQDALQKQATDLRDKYDDIVIKMREKTKNKFINNIQANRQKTMETVHDVNVEKHRAVEKLRHFLECQNLACQVYVAAMEKEKCNLKLNELKAAHSEKILGLNEEIKIADEQISIAEKRQIKQREFNKIWQTKVCHVVRRFQLFVTYSLKLIPEHAEFFINMENLMLLQLSESVETSKSESIFESEVEFIPTTVAAKEVDPYVVVGDMKMKSNKATSDVPTFIINKRCIYAVCENIQELTDKLQEFVLENDDTSNLKDDYDYSFSMPVKYTSEDKLNELKLESSLMQIIQNEISNLENTFNECCICKAKECLVAPKHSSITADTKSSTKLYFKKTVIKPRTGLFPTEVCKCQERAKRELIERLPPYMLKTSLNQPIDMNYEPCPPSVLQELVARSRRGKKPKTKESGIQFSDNDFDILKYSCCCNKELVAACKPIPCSSVVKLNIDKFEFIDDEISSTYLCKSPRSFATERALELKKLIGSSEYLQDIFRKSDCNF